MRSKTLIVSAIYSSIIGISSLIYLISFLSEGGIEALELLNALAEIVGGASDAVLVTNIIFALLVIFVALYVIGALFAWISVITKKSGFAKFGAVMYLLGTIAFPVVIFIGIPAIVLGFIGASKQKNLSVQ